MAANIARMISVALVASSAALSVIPACARDGGGMIASVPLVTGEEDVAPDMTGSPRLAIGGYDTVAYHTMGKAVPGRLEYQTIWHDARWQFSSKENLDLFIKDPEKYAAHVAQ